MNTYKQAIEQLERQLFCQAMEENRYNQVRAALALGISRGTLRTKLKEYFGDKYIGTRDLGVYVKSGVQLEPNYEASDSNSVSR